MQGYKFEKKKKKNYHFYNTQHMTHLLKLRKKTCEYGMDRASIVEDTEQTRFCQQTDRQMDRRTDKWTRWNQYTPIQLHWSRGYDQLPGILLYYQNLISRSIVISREDEWIIQQQVQSNHKIVMKLQLNNLWHNNLYWHQHCWHCFSEKKCLNNSSKISKLTFGISLKLSIKIFCHLSYSHSCATIAHCF